MIDNKLPKQAVNELQRKVGRNILVYQKIELAMKDLLAKNNTSGKTDELSKVFEKRLQDNRKKTLGGLTQSFINDFYKSDEKGEHEFDDNKPSIGLNISIKTEDVSEIEKNYQGVVSSRNFIVHNFLERYIFASVEDCAEAEAYLDFEYDKAKIFLNDLLGIYDSLNEFAQELQSKSEYIRNRIQKFTDADDLSRHMASEMIQGFKRDDGWIVLSTASTKLRTECPELFVDMKKYGHNSLKKVMESSDLFEFYSEETLKGGKRDLFRLK